MRIYVIAVTEAQWFFLYNPVIQFQGCLEDFFPAALVRYEAQVHCVEILSECCCLAREYL